MKCTPAVNGHVARKTIEIPAIYKTSVKPAGSLGLIVNRHFDDGIGKTPVITTH
jgi:hypothetical protein